MRRIALVLMFSTVFATNFARANDINSPADKSKDAVTDVPKDPPTTSESPVKDSDTVAPAIRLEQPTSFGTMAGASLLRTMHVGLALSQVYDIYSTEKAISRGAVEMNPLLQNTVASRAAFIGLKAAMTLGPIYEAEKLWRGHHRIGAIALMSAANAIMLGVAAHNADIMNHAVTTVPVR